MKIGVFDSGLGGLLIAKAVRAALPQYDYLYFGDTLHVPYGRRSPEAIYKLVEQAVSYMFAQDCALIIIACNTASAAVLRRLQQEYLPAHYPDRRILGVVVPTLEVATEHQARTVGLLATEATVESSIYAAELEKIDPGIVLKAQAAPLLVPLMEHHGEEFLRPCLEKYLAPLLEAGIESLILGCTHYCKLKDMARELVPAGVDVLSQDEIIPGKLADYLSRHPEMETRLSRGGAVTFTVSDITRSIGESAQAIFEEPVTLGKVVVG